MPARFFVETTAVVVDILELLLPESEGGSG